MPSRFTSGKIAALTGAIRGWNFKHRPRFASDFVFGVRLAKKRQDRAVGAGGRLDHVGHKPLLPLLVEIAQILAAELHVLAKVVITPVRDPLELADCPKGNVYSMSAVAVE